MTQLGSGALLVNPHDAGAMALTLIGERDGDAPDHVDVENGAPATAAGAVMEDAWQ